MSRKRERKPAPSFSNFGFSTILLAFVMICIVTISALSLLTANSDYKLSQKVAQKNSEYYLAEEKAYEELARVDALLALAYYGSTSENSYFAAVEEALASSTIGTYENNIYKYEIQISEKQTLEISLLIQYPSHSDDTFYQIKSWKSAYEVEVPEDEFLDLID